MEKNVRSFCVQIRKKNADNADDRTLTFVASDGTRDSAHTVLNQDGWQLDRFNANPVIGYQHDIYGGWANDPDNVIGKGHAYIEEQDGKKLLMVDITFEGPDINEKADKIYKKLLFGSLNSVSVGFMPVGRGAWGKGDEGPGEANETYYYAGQELLEISVVNIPANPNATAKRSDDPIQQELEELRKQGAPAQDPAPEASAEVEAIKARAIALGQSAIL